MEIFKKFVIFYLFAEKPPMDGFARNFEQGVVTPTLSFFSNSFVNQSSGLGSARGRILPFSIDLAGRH